MSRAMQRPTPASAWWRMVSGQCDVLREFLDRAKKADLHETGHDCGHEFTFTVTMRGHSWGTGDDPTHSDAQYADTLKPVTVRASNLRDACLLAAVAPMSSWFEEEEG